MIADSYFAIGRRHRVCQDYARASVVDEDDESVAYACLSDGCSGSIDTDIGARLACLSAMHYWSGGAGALVPARWLGEFLAERGSRMWEWLGIGHQALHATLLGVYWAASQASPTITILGDGAVAGAKRDGSGLSGLLHRYDPDSQGRVTPFYPIYAASPSGRWGGTSKLWWLSDHDEACVHVPGEDVDGVSEFASDSILGTTPDVVAVFSDGVESFKRKDDAGRVIPVAALDVIAQCMTFRGALTPGFVARRCISFLERFCPANGWFHTDDFSMAAVARPRSHEEESDG